MLLYYTNVLYYTIEETVKLTLRLTKQIINNFLMCKKGATSTDYWGLVNKKLCPQLTWSIKGKYITYNSNSRECGLCLHEKLKIVDDPDQILPSRLRKDVPVPLLK